MSVWCIFAAVTGSIGFLCGLTAIFTAWRAKREYQKARAAHCKWCGLDGDGKFDG